MKHEDEETSAGAKIYVCTLALHFVGVGGTAQTRLSFFLSIVHHVSKQRAAPRGMASQHLLTFEKVLFNTSFV